MSGVREIPLSRGMMAIVDEADFDWLNQWKWSALKVGRKGSEPKFYAVRVITDGGRQKMLMMHRVIAGAISGLVVDHFDLNTLNNSRSNLRLTTQANNSLNQNGHRDRSTSQFKGVYFHNQRKKYVANFRGKYLGIFSSEEDAARAYDQAAHSYNEQFSRLNFA